MLFVWADLSVCPYACFLHDIVLMRSNFDTLKVPGKDCKQQNEAQFLIRNNFKLEFFS